jgi:hypothetical protein
MPRRHTESTCSGVGRADTVGPAAGGTEVAGATLAPFAGSDGAPPAVGAAGVTATAGRAVETVPPEAAPGAGAVRGEVTAGGVVDVGAGDGWPPDGATADGAAIGGVACEPSFARLTWENTVRLQTMSTARAQTA